MSVGLAPNLRIFSAEDSPSTLLSSQAVLAASTSAVTSVCASALVLETPLFLATQCLDSTQSVHTHTFAGCPAIQNHRLSSCVMKPFPVFVATQ